VIGMVASLRAAERARAQAEHARIEADSFGLMARLMGDALLRGADDEAGRARVEAELSRYADQVRRQHAGHPHLRANLIDALGQAFAQLERFDEARALLEEAHATRIETFGERSLEHALSLGSLGQLAHRSGRFAEAAELLAQALELHRELEDDVHTDVALAANDLAASLHKLGRPDEALALHEEALALRRAGGVAGELSVAESLNNLALVLLDRGQEARARERIEEALELRTRILGPTHALALQTRGVLAGVLWRLGRAQEAAGELRVVVDGYRELGGVGREGLIVNLGNLAVLELQTGALDAAGAHAQEALAASLDLFGPDHPRTATARSRVAGLLAQRGENAAAREAWREVLRVQRLAFPQDHPTLAGSLQHLANAELADGRAAEAAPLLEEAAAILSAPGREESVELAGLELSLGVCARLEGRADDARAHFEAGLALFTRLEGADSQGATRARDLLASLPGAR
jgi:tetratricopeptide (TPR) repeat protein